MFFFGHSLILTAPVSRKVPNLEPMRFSYIIAIYIYNINVHWNIPSCIFLFTTIYNGGQNNLEHCGKTFQIIVTLDCASNDNFWIGFRVIPSSPDSPRMLNPNRGLFPPILLKTPLCLGLQCGRGRGREERGCFITGKVPTLFTSDYSVGQ